MSRHEFGSARHISGMFQECAQRWQVSFMVGVVGVITCPEDQIADGAYTAQVVVASLVPHSE